MNKENFINELKQYEGDNCIIVETNEDEYTIEDGANYIGGFEGTYMCSLLGNVCYDSLELIATPLYNFIEKLNETITDVHPY